jgi:hypothetical protein
MPARQAFIRAAIERLRAKLLDLTVRNPLLAFKHSARSRRYVRVGNEVLCLAENGYASGALARWRTMHEIGVVCLFLREHEPELSRRYLLFDAIDSYKSAYTHDQYADRLNCFRPSPEEMATVHAAREALKKEFGDEFERPYGWAHGAVKGKPTFDAIQAAVELDHWHPRIKLASQETHAEAKPTYWNLSAGTQDKGLLVGSSPEGLAEALHPMMISLNMASASLVAQWPSDSRILHLKVLDELAGRGGEALLAGAGQDSEGASATSGS